MKEFKKPESEWPQLFIPCLEKRQIERNHLFLYIYACDMRFQSKPLGSAFVLSAYLVQNDRALQQQHIMHHLQYTGSHLQAAGSAKPKPAGKWLQGLLDFQKQQDIGLVAL